MNRKIFNLILTFMLALLSALPACMTAAAAEKPVIALGSAKGQLGDTVDISVTMSGNPGFVSANLYVNYDTDVLSLKSVKDGGLLDGVTHSDNFETSPYGLCWVNDLAPENFKVNGVLATLTFEIKKMPASGKSEITLDQDILNYDIESVVFELSKGVIEVVAPSQDSSSSLQSQINSAQTQSGGAEASDSSSNDKGSSSAQISGDSDEAEDGASSSESKGDKTEDSSDLSSADKNAVNSASGSNSSSSSDGNGLVWIIVIAAFVLLLGAALLVVWLKKRRSR